MTEAASRRIWVATSDWSPTDAPRSLNACSVARSPCKAPCNSRRAFSHSFQADSAFSNESSSLDVLEKNILLKMLYDESRGAIIALNHARMKSETAEKIKPW